MQLMYQGGFRNQATCRKEEAKAEGSLPNLAGPSHCSL